ncbi:MAG: hypothetical protein WC533_04270 [Candidatus Pacearchaeota archaeon]
MIIKAEKDINRVKSMVSLVLNREEFVSSIDINKFPTIALENYYEIVRELGSALILTEGFKPAGENAHKDLIDFLVKKKFILESEAYVFNSLRIRRNKSYYEGKTTEENYLADKLGDISSLIKKLKYSIKTKLNNKGDINVKRS